MFLMFSESHEIPTSKPPISIRGSWTPRLSAACVRGVIPARVSVCVRVCACLCASACVYKHLCARVCVRVRSLLGSRR